MSLPEQELQDNGEPDKMDTTDETLQILEKMENPDTLEDTPNQSKKNRKRKSADINSILRKKKKLASHEKNPLMQLNELKPGLTYCVEAQSGPPHSPLIKMSVIVNSQKFIGVGNSKQMAKHAAAQAALLSFVQFRNTEAMNVISQASATADFTVDNAENGGCNFNKNGADGELISTGISPKVVSEADKKNPVMLLNELHPGLTYSLKEENLLAPSRRFCMVLEVNGKTYEGTGQSKKLAKASAACSVLSDLYQIAYNPYSKTIACNDSKEAELSNFPQTVADEISKSLMNTFNDVMVGSPEFIKWKVIAGIAMTKDPDMKDVQIITIGTGTKCVSGEHISMVGANVNDCHAEIISRRCLKDFFYTNLELFLKGEADESIFMKRDAGGFSLKSDIKFHLYISTAPCGDARIFSPHEEGVIGAIDRHPNRNSRGVLRTKIESGEGTIPVRGKQAIQTWDSILPGQERLLTMSCSDKIAYWNVLGLQGALLSHFIEPIYLDSVILGGLFNSNHLQRALFGRIDSYLSDLPEKFRLNKPKMCATTSPEMRNLSKSPNFSVNWTLGLRHAEVVNATTGKTESGQVSRLSKRSFFQRFLNIYDKLSHIATFETPDPLMYSSFKSTVKDYREAQKALNSAFTAAGLGCWIKKPVEQNEFEQ